MDNSLQTKLELEVYNAKVAKHAYDNYLNKQFEKERLELFNQFCNASVDSGELITIKHAQMALDGLEQRTLTIIESGKLATQQLNQE